MSGKGDKRRPRRIDKEIFDDNWERLFGRQEPEIEPMTRGEKMAVVVIALIFVSLFVGSFFVGMLAGADTIQTIEACGRYDYCPEDIK